MLNTLVYVLIALWIMTLSEWPFSTAQIRTFVLKTLIALIHCLAFVAVIGSFLGAIEISLIFMGIWPDWMPF
jgi:hypothetical protein